MTNSNSFRVLLTLALLSVLAHSRTLSADPAPADAPRSISSDPAPANAPLSVVPADQLVPLIDMPDLNSALSNDPAPAGPPGGSLAVPKSPAVVKGGPFLGVGFRNPDKSVVTTLYQESTAARLGIQLGDVIVSVNGISTESIYKLREALSSLAIGDAATVIVERGGTTLKLGPKSLGAKP